MSLYFRKQLLADLFQIHWPFMQYPKSSRKPPRKPAHFFPVRKSKPFSFGTLFLTVLLPGEFLFRLTAWCGDGDHSQLGIEVNPLDWVDDGVKCSYQYVWRESQFMCSWRKFFEIAVDLCFSFLFSYLCLCHAEYRISQLQRHLSNLV